MSAFRPDPLQATTGSPHRLPLPPRIPWVMVLFHLGLGGVALALALSEQFAAGKAAFAGDAWRVVLGVAGAGIAFTGARGAMRNLNASVPILTEERARGGRIRGLLLVLVGAGFTATMTSRALAESTVEFHAWTRPLFFGGGLYLLLLGLVLQMNPANTLARQRISQGLGVPGVATILHAGDPDATPGAPARVRIDLEMEVEGRRFASSEDVVVEQAQLPLVVPGATVDVVVDRERPTVFEIDWDSWRGPAS